MTLFRIVPLLLCVSLAAPAAAFSHRAFDKILKKYVRRGKVDYAGIRENAKDELAAYVKRIGEARPPRGRSAKLAFYLNAYNALVIEAVVERWPDIKSVIKVKGFFNGAKYSVAGERMTLNDLENKVIRPTFKDARIHFALVCAARSCPPLPSRAFRARGLSRVLDRLAKRFINSRAGVRRDGETFKVSKLFTWYAKDFEETAGSVAKYLARYHEKYGEALSAGPTLKYQSYNWNLNQR